MREIDKTDLDDLKKSIDNFMLEMKSEFRSFREEIIGKHDKTEKEIDDLKDEIKELYIKSATHPTHKQIWTTLVVVITVFCTMAGLLITYLELSNKDHERDNRRNENAKRQAETAATKRRLRNESIYIWTPASL